jgi:superfamily II DNA or RNA helicase
VYSAGHLGEAIVAQRLVGCQPASLFSYIGGVVESTSKTSIASISQVAKGSILHGPFWPEPVRVLSAQVRHRRIEVHAVGLQTERYFSDLLDLGEFEANVRVTVRDAPLNFTANPGHFRLAVEAHRIRLAYEFDPHFAVSVSQIDPLPHQLEAVYHYMSHHPRVRFLLADDPGAGKTIMAGLLLKELKYRGIVERTLVITPANLTDQWQREMRDKFGESFTVVNRATLESFYGESVWEARPQCITSVDFAKQDDVLETLRGVDWDLVIVDEAHKMAAYRYPGREKTRKTSRYRLGEVLSEQAHHLLFLTATPHKGDPENFLLLLQLLDPDLYASTEILRQAVQRQENPIFLRRMKEDMLGFDGKPLFPPRHAQTVGYKLSPIERDLYNAVTRYVEIHFQRAFQEENRNVQLALTVLQRRLASSLRAIRKSLENRRRRLREIQRVGRLLMEAPQAWQDEELEDLPEMERWRIEDEAVARFTMARDLQELGREIEELDRLLTLAHRAEAAGTERKLEELRLVMQEENLFPGGRDASSHSDEKLLIFTEARDTLEYLVEKLQSWGFRVTQIHGGMRLGDRGKPGTRLHAEETFRNPQGAQIMVATEAAGEGINLQFCHLVVNWDIPWNPNRLEQRMGRVHRYGQTREVFIYNLVASDTREGSVLEALLTKLEAMRQDLGDRVYDVVGELVEGVRLEQLFREALARRRSFEEIRREVETRLDERALQRIQEATLEGLATRHIDLSRLQREADTAREQRLVPEYIERFFVEAFQGLGGKIERRTDGLWRIEWVPARIRSLPPEVERRFGKAAQTYRQLTFHKKEMVHHPEAEFVGPGHPLFEAVIYHVLTDYGPALREGTVFLDPEGGGEGALWFLRGGVRDGRGETVGERLFAAFQPIEGGLALKSPTVLLDLQEGRERDQPLPSRFQRNQVSEKAEAVVDWSLDHVMDPYLEEMRGRRSRELQVKAQYLKHSLNTLISHSNRKLGDYQRRLNEGEDMARAIAEEEKRKEALMRRRDERLAEIRQAEHLTPRPPEVLGIAAVLPAPAAQDPEVAGAMARDDEVEAIAMGVAMDYEREQGREPEDVAAQALGFDVRSAGPEGTRYIEVKGRAAVGGVALTRNEWIKAGRFGEDYWLYIVVNCKTAPQLYVLQNPAAVLRPEEELEVVRYIVRVEAWQRYAEKVLITSR